MKKIFYRFNNEIYIDYQAIYEWAQSLGIEHAIAREVCCLKSRLHPHATERTLLLAS